HVRALALSADGTRAVTACTGDKGGEAVVWDVEEGAALARLTEEGTSVTAAALAADGESFFYSTETGELCQADLATGKAGPRWQLSKGIQALWPLGDGRVAVAGREEVLLWDPAAGKAAARLTLREGYPLCVGAGGEGPNWRLACASYVPNRLG